MKLHSVVTHPLLRSLPRLLVVACIATVVAGCSMLPSLDEVLPDRRTEYRKSKNLPDLEVPPDLTTDAIRDRMAIPEGGQTATFSTYQERVAERRKQEELERTANSAIQLLENEHVLAVEGQAVQIWPRLRAFFQKIGYEIELDDDELGVLETAWRENQEALTRDKFKVFAEPGEKTGTTVLYISHRGEELQQQGQQMVWEARPRDVELEGRLVERLQEDLTGIPAGSSAVTASSGGGSYAASPVATTGGPQQAELISAGGGKVYLAVSQPFDSAWRSTARVLPPAGVEVAEEDRAKGVYYVKLEGAGEKKGMLSKLKFWGDGDKHRLTLTGVGDKTEVVLLDAEGQWETDPAAAQLLTRLQREFNAGAY